MDINIFDKQYNDWLNQVRKNNYKMENAAIRNRICVFEKITNHVTRQIVIFLNTDITINPFKFEGNGKDFAKHIMVCNNYSLVNNSKTNTLAVIV